MPTSSGGDYKFMNDAAGNQGHRTLPRYRINASSLGVRYWPERSQSISTCFASDIKPSRARTLAALAAEREYLTLKLWIEAIAEGHTNSKFSSKDRYVTRARRVKVVIIQLKSRCTCLESEFRVILGNVDLRSFFRQPLHEHFHETIIIYVVLD